MPQLDERRKIEDEGWIKFTFHPSSFILRLCLAFIAGILFTAACGADADSSVGVSPELAASAAAGVAPADTPVAAPDAAVVPVIELSPTASSTPIPSSAVAAPDAEVNLISFSGSYWPGWAGINCATYTKRPAAFCNAMKDAEIAEPDEISTSLMAVAPHNQDLVWSGAQGESRVLAVTWSSFIDRTPPDSQYDPKNGFRVGQPMVSARDVFVTLAPELREFCQARSPFRNRPLRIEQLLGLAPNGGKDSRGNARAFVEIWADPQDLFRPTPDPEITDREAGLDFPGSGRFLTVSEEHIKWFKEFKSISYEETGLPWTRLGYTYDWGNQDSEIGLSEFVIKAGANVKVFSITSTEEYCQ